MSGVSVKGSCHCGAVTFVATINLGEPTIRCNCSICTKSRAWLAPISSPEFKILTGEDSLVEYRFGRNAITHCFCARCGVKTHGRVTGDDGQETIVAVSVTTLDLSPERLSAMKVSYANGRRDRFDETPDLVGYL
jgi:hypothetical protein